MTRISALNRRWSKDRDYNVRPSTDALERFAQATRTRLRIAFEPQPAR